MTKEEIQTEYNGLVTTLGEKVYKRFLVSICEILNIGNRLMFLNQEMHRIQQEAKECPESQNPLDTK